MNSSLLAGSQSQAGGGSTTMGYNDQQFAFLARMENIKVLSLLLKAISFKDRANIFISETGLKVSVEDCKCAQMNAFINKDLFEEYVLREGMGDEPESNELAFSVSLPAVIECLNVFGSSGDGASPHLKMCYAGYGHPFIMFIEHQGDITDCKIKTREVEDCADFNFAKANIISKVIMVSERLKDVFMEMDTSCELISFTITSHLFSLATAGSAGDSTAEIPSSSDIVEIFSCSAPISAKYKLSMLRHGLKPLSFSERVSVRMDDREFLSMQHMIKTDDGPAFLEFYCCPEEEFPDR